MNRGTSVKKSANRPNPLGVPCVDRQLFFLFGEVHVESVFFVNEASELLGADETSEDANLFHLHLDIRQRDSFFECLGKFIHDRLRKACRGIKPVPHIL